MYRKGKLWVAVIDLGWVDGKRKRNWYYAATQAEARQKLDDAKNRRAKGLPVAVSKKTVAAYLASWLETKRDLRSRTWHRYEEIVRVHINPRIGKLTLVQLGICEPCISSPSESPRCLVGAFVSFAPCSTRR